jgi:hypothetical protein
MGLHVIPRYSCQILMKIKFFRQIFKNTQISNILKIRLLGAEFFYADRRTDGHDETNSRFSQFDESVGKCCRNVQTLASVEMAGNHNMQNVNTEYICNAARNTACNANMVGCQKYDIQITFFTFRKQGMT